MEKRALVTIVALVIALAIALGLLLQSRRHVASLEARIATLEQKNGELATRAETLQLDRANLEAKLRRAEGVRISEEIVSPPERRAVINLAFPRAGHFVGNVAV